MSRFWMLGILAAGCAPVSEAPVIAPKRWVHVEGRADQLDYPAGDGEVSGASRVLVLRPSPPLSRGRRPAPSLKLPERIQVGEVFRIEIRVPRAEDGDRRTFRLTCGRPGLRLLDGEVVLITGRDVVLRRAVADSAGPAAFDLEEIGD